MFISFFLWVPEEIESRQGLRTLSGFRVQGVGRNIYLEAGKAPET